MIVSNSPLLIVVLIVGCLGNLWCAEPPIEKSVTAVPNGTFPAVDYGTIGPGSVLVLNVDAPPGYVITSGDCSGGGNSPWTKISNTKFTAVILDSYRGQHAGAFKGTMSKTPTGQGGESPAAPIVWDGTAKALVFVVTSRTKRRAADQTTPDTRRTVGVCEEVVFTTDPLLSATWEANGGAPTSYSGDTFNWIAPEAPASITVTARISGRAASLTMTVIKPSSAAWKLRAATTSGYAPGFAGAQMTLVNCSLDPKSVNFERIMIHEMSGPASAVSGYFATNPPFTTNAPTPAPLSSPAGVLWHRADGTTGLGGGAWLPIGPLNVTNASGDIAGVSPPGIDPAMLPFSTGSYTWVIPYHYRSITSTTTVGTYFADIHQVFTMAAGGTMTVTKTDGSICTVTRTP